MLEKYREFLSVGFEKLEWFIVCIRMSAWCDKNR